MDKRTIIAAILIIAILAGGSGCMFSKQESFRSLAIDYMEQKYGESFSFVSSRGSGYSPSDAQEVFVKTDSLPGKILVKGIPENGSFTFSDNYLAVKYAQEMTDAVKTVSDAIFGESLVFYEVLPQTLSTALSPDASFEAYSTDPDSGISVSVAIPVRAFRPEDVEAYAEAFQKTGITALIRFLVTEDDSYSGLDPDSFSRCITSKDYHYYAVIQIDQKSFTVSPRKVG